jgi:hypothetical protein
MKKILTAVVLALALTSTASAQSPNFSTIATKLTGKTVTVNRGITPTTEALTDTSTNMVTLRPHIWNELTAPYAYMRTPWAVAIFAHELGHIVRGMSELDANCWARANLYRVARALGWGPHMAKVITHWGLKDSRTFCTEGGE